MIGPIAIFLVLVFLAMFLLMQGLVIPTFGSSARMQRRLRRRLDELAVEPTAETPSLLRRRYLERLSPLERRLEALPGMSALRRTVEQAGIDQCGDRLAVLVDDHAVVPVLHLGEHFAQLLPEADCVGFGDHRMPIRSM